MFSGTSPDGNLVEFVELPRDVHPYYVATQAHPELPLPPDPPAPAVHGAGRCRPRSSAELRFPIDESGLRREPEDEGLHR